MSKRQLLLLLLGRVAVVHKVNGNWEVGGHVAVVAGVVVFAVLPIATSK